MKRWFIAAALALASWSAASAQDGGAIRVRVGAGAQLQPAYPGADKDKVGPLFHLDIARGTNPFRFKGPDDPAGISLIDTHGFSAGPEVNLQRRRKDSDVGAPVGNVRTTIEAGAFAQYDDLSSFRVRGDIRKGLGGHNGIVGSVGADKYWRDSDRYTFSVGPRVLFSNSRYQEAYFGVTPAASAATGLPVYRPKSGIHAVALASGVTYQMSARFGLFGFGRYERLVGDAAKSPIVRAFGSRNQYSAGLGLTYTFSTHL
jgi:outer membrane protein